ncbi:P-loop containing nucleoside triphosphate hydrolase protein [Tricladium varicosporioides]|nr:P-loop containing nucleoside triphosphate hydrolase protein [Hymenoscyphus varicosporioides]
MLKINEVTQEEKHTHVSQDDLNIDQNGSKRSIPMEVLNLSMPRTGSVSMQLALEILGIPTFHSFDLFTNTKDCALWSELLDAKYFSNSVTPRKLSRSDFDSLLGHYSGASDVPCIAFTPELIAAYPEAKVILVDRDIEKWYNSFNNAVIIHTFAFKNWFVARIDPYLVGPLETMHKRWVRGWFRSNNTEEMRANARSMYVEHYDLVKKITPKGNLLVYKLGDGWEPLCEFLGKDIPEIEFPRVNDTDTMNEKLRSAAVQGFKNGMGIAAHALAPIVCIGVAIWWLSF